MRIVAILALALCLGSCATQTIKEKLNLYSGQPASVIIARLGYPTSEQTVAGAKGYIWSTNRFIEGTSIGCKIRVMVDAQEIVTAWDFEGSESGCAAYASMLRR